MQQKALLIALVFLAGCEGPPNASPGASPAEGVPVRMPRRRGEPEAPCAAVYGWSDTPPWVKLVLALWSDGRMVWSRDSFEGGPPYLEGKVPAAAVRKALDGLARRGVFSDPVRRERHFGPDSSYTTVAISDGGRRLDMASWHELAERDPHLVGTSSGLVILEGRSRQEILAREPRRYLRFREVWGELRTALAALVPAGGVPVEGVEFDLSRP